MAAIRVVRCLQGTTPTGTVIGDVGSIQRANGSNVVSLSAYSNGDWVGNIKTDKYTGGYMVLSNGGLVAWCSSNQRCVAAS